MLAALWLGQTQTRVQKPGIEIHKAQNLEVRNIRMTLSPSRKLPRTLLLSSTP